MTKKLTKISALILSMLLAVGCTATTATEVPSLPENSASSPVSSESVPEEPVQSSEPESEPEPEPEPQPKTVSFAAVGDNLIHGSIYLQAKTSDGYDFSSKYANIKDDIAAADVAIINQETLICNDAYPPSNWPRFNTPTALGDHMIDIGFDVFTIANNHCLDYGEEGLGHALDYWESRTEAHNILMAGVYHKGDDRIRLDERNGIVFSYLSFTDNLNGLKQIPNSQYEIGNANDLDEMVTYIKAAKEVSDVCIVAMHWGIEESTVITEGQRELARKLAEAGANVIIGTSPHVLRDIEVIHTDDHDTLCAYSLGNFISAQSGSWNMISGILNFNVTLEDGEAPIVSDIKLVPTVTHYDWNYANVRIYKLSDYTKELAASHGVNERYKFSINYIVNFLKDVVDEQFLDLENIENAL